MKRHASGEREKANMKDLALQKSRHRALRVFGLCSKDSSATDSHDKTPITMKGRGSADILSTMVGEPSAMSNFDAKSNS